MDEFVDMNEALEIIRQLQEDHPDLYRRIAELRDGIRCGYANGRSGSVVLCRAGRYRQLYWVDEHGNVLTRDAPYILNLMKCTPDTPAAPLPADHNAVVMQVKHAFEREQASRQAEQQHTLALTKAQRYVLDELRALYAESDDALRRQIAVLDAAFQQPLTRPAIRTALNRIRRESLTGRAPLEALTQLYHLYGMEPFLPQTADHGATNETLACIVCSEGFVKQV